jgi:hypothetical protein
MWEYFELSMITHQVVRKSFEDTIYGLSNAIKPLTLGDCAPERASFSKVDLTESLRFLT